MLALATHLVSVLRGGGFNAFGDPIDTDVTVLSKVPMSIVEATRNTTTHADDRQQTVTQFVGRCNRTVDVRQGDRLRLAGGTTMLVTSVAKPVGVALAVDARLDLTWVRTPAAGTAPVDGSSVIGAATIPFVIGA